MTSRKEWYVLQNYSGHHETHPILQISGRVMIDPVRHVNKLSEFRNHIVGNSIIDLTPTYVSDEQSSDPQSIPPRDNLESFDPENLIAEELMTFPSRIGGFSLVTKDIAYFLVDEVREVTWDIRRADDLRATSEKMQDALRIASGFSFLPVQFGYENKGAGLTFLFFGPSGVGKTLTAGKLPIISM